jgi:hypothetical protein
MIEALSRCLAMIDDKKLEERLVALEAAKSWSPRVVSRLEMLLRSGADEALYRINPIQFAAEKSIAEAEAIDLFLHACVAGLFDMDWLLVCPMCSDVVESLRFRPPCAASASINRMRFRPGITSSIIN